MTGCSRGSARTRPAHSRRHLYVTSYTEGFSHFVTSMTAPVASGWSGCRVGLAPTGKRRLLTAHTLTGHSRSRRLTSGGSGRPRRTLATVARLLSRPPRSRPEQSVCRRSTADCGTTAAAARINSAMRLTVTRRYRSKAGGNGALTCQIGLISGTLAHARRGIVDRLWCDARHSRSPRRVRCSLLLIIRELRPDEDESRDRWVSHRRFCRRGGGCDITVMVGLCAHNQKLPFGFGISD